MKRETTVEVCAWCVAIIYARPDVPFIVKTPEGDDQSDNRYTPRQICDFIMQGYKVIHRSTYEAYSLAVTSVNGTALCGWHGYHEIERMRLGQNDRKSR